jgi:hypothetical protein
MIVIFNGPPRSGKDVGAEYFERAFGFSHLTFKEEIFKQACRLFEVEFDWFMSEYDSTEGKEKPSTFLGGLSRREALIYTSENHIKPKYGNAFFGEAVAKNIDHSKNYVISDGGFIEELTPIINKIGYKNISLVQLIRNDCSYEKDSRRYFNGTIVDEFVLNTKSKFEAQYLQSTEVPIDTYRVYNNGSFTDYYNALEKIKFSITENMMSLT